MDCVPSLEAGIEAFFGGLTGVMDRRWLSAAALAALLFAGACSTSGAAKKDTGIGTRTLECVIEEKGQEGPSSASGYRTGGNYYMVFEAREGQATSRYRLEVTRPQWQRFQEGQRVKITLNNNILIDIRPDE
jgi:hypothetical protein